MADTPEASLEPGDGDATAAMPPPLPFTPGFLAIDISGSTFSAGLVSPAGELLHRGHAPVSEDDSAEVLFDAVTTVVDQQLASAEQHRVRIVAVGVGCSGPIGPDCETVSPVNLPGWREFPLRARLRELTAKPVYGELDVKALALAEGWVGAAQGAQNYCVITVSTGIGGGIVVDGELLDGAAGNAGYVGHINVEPLGRRCQCGGRGCLEAEASGIAIEAITGRPPSEPTYEIMQRTGRYVGRAAGSLCNLLDLDLVVVAGSVAIGFAATFLNAAQEELSTVARLPYSRQARITPSRLGDRGALLAAGAVGIKGWQRDRARARAMAANAGG